MPETLEKLLLRWKIFLAISLMTKLTLALTLTDPHDDAKCYSVSRSPIDENNDSVSKSWIVIRHGIVAKLLRRNFPPQKIYPYRKALSNKNPMGILTEVGTQFLSLRSIAYHEYASTITAANVTIRLQRTPKADISMPII